MCLAGCRIPRGAVNGKTNANGTAVEDGKVDHGNLFHTYLEAVGVNSRSSFDIDGREVPIADPSSAPVVSLLS